MVPILAGVACAGAAAYVYSRLAPWGEGWPGLLVGSLCYIAIVAVGSILASFGVPLVNRVRKYDAVHAAEVMAGDARPPVLYLRSFPADAIAARVTRIQLGELATEEERLAEVMEPIGPFIAIGKPGERLPELGASRIYVGDDQWQATVRDLMSRARLVVLRVGGNGSLWWELEEARKHLTPGRLLLCIPHDEPQYTSFRRKAEDELQLHLPAFPSGVARCGSLAGFIHFAEDWMPTFAPIRRHPFRGDHDPSYTKLFMAIRPVYERLGLRWKKPTSLLTRFFMIIFSYFIVYLMLYLTFTIAKASNPPWDHSEPEITFLRFVDMVFSIETDYKSYLFVAFIGGTLVLSSAVIGMVRPVAGARHGPIARMTVRRPDPAP